MWSSWDSNRRPMADREPEAAPTVRVLSIEDLTQIAEHREMHERSYIYIYICDAHDILPYVLPLFVPSWIIDVIPI